MLKETKWNIFFVFVMLFVCVFLLAIIFFAPLRAFILKLPNIIQVSITHTSDNLDCSTFDQNIDQNFPISTDRQDFVNLNDEDFANFRSLSSLGLNKKTIYRGSSPIDNVFQRAQYCDKACQQANIKNIINLENTKEEAELMPSFFNTYYSKQNILYAPISVSLNTDDDRQKVYDIFEFIANNEGPIFIHCNDGCDKTAMICSLISLLETSSYDYMKADYYQSYYCLRTIQTGQQTVALRQWIDNKYRCLLADILGLTSQNITYSNLNLYARNYLINCKLSCETIDTISQKLKDNCA